MERIKIKDTTIRNNRKFQEDQGMFHRKIQETKLLKRKVPKMEKFEELWVRIRENSTNTPQRKWMNTDAKKIGQKVMNVHESMITEKKLRETVKK